MPIDAIKAGLTALCEFGALALFAVCFIVNVQRLIDEAKRRMRNADKAVLSMFTVALTIFAGAKHAQMNAGADAAISLVSVGAEYDSTNDVTSVEVRFTGQGVTTATPVSVRNDQTEAWRELEKIGAEITTDFTTNILSFGVYGNVGTNRYWWVGTETPAPSARVERFTCCATRAAQARRKRPNRAVSFRPPASTASLIT